MLNAGRDLSAALVRLLSGSMLMVTTTTVTFCLPQGAIHVDRLASGRLEKVDVKGVHYAVAIMVRVCRMERGEASRING